MAESSREETTAPTLLRVLVTRRHWQVYETFRHHYERAAQALAEREGDRRVRGLTVSKRQFERWYGGELKTRPYPDQCRVLEALFDHPVDELLGPAQPEHTASPRTVPTLSVHRSAAARTVEPAPRAGPLAATLDTGTWGDPGTGERERQVEMAARRAFRFGSAAEGSTVVPETLAQLHDEVRRLADAYPRLPLPTLLGDLVEVQDTTFRILEHGRVRPSQAKELYLLAGMTSGMLAKASHDVGDPRSAMMQARTAYVCADNADHPAMRAWVRGMQSLINYWAGRPQEAARYAALGTAVGEDVRGTTSIWLACLEARAYALLGDAPNARAAAARAEDTRDALRPDDLDSYGGILTFPRARQLYYVAEAVVHLRDDPRGAQAQADAAVAAYRDAPPEEWAFGDEAGAQTNLALSRVAAGELEGAVEAVRPVLELPFDQRNFGVLVSVRRVHDALSDARFLGTRAAADVREEIEEFTAGPTTAQLQ
ncbi:hypothetical protein [Streptodolium elevatio]|uniref:Uncharacterized protein n=1 Tax=Streptodolium elevatio TaxID=3157996 RepID=A0ABV3DRP8_9ACTN